jgi:hypothetical protein
MASMTRAARQLVTHGRIGTVQRTYSPHTVGRLIGGVILLPAGLVVSAAISAFVHADSADGDPSVPTSRFPPAVQHYAPLGGLVFSLFGVIVLLVAVAQRNHRLVICDRGVALATGKVRDTFLYAQVRQVKHRRITTTTTYSTPNGLQTSPGPTQHRVTVECFDGRRFVLDSGTFGSRVRRIGKEIEQRAVATRGGR